MLALGARLVPPGGKVPLILFSLNFLFLVIGELCLAPVGMFGRATADGNRRMGQGVAAACVGTADDHGLALTADPVGPAVGDIHECEKGRFGGHACRLGARRRLGLGQI